jgi:hypothetical protein
VNPTDRKNGYIIHLRVPRKPPMLDDKERAEKRARVERSFDTWAEGLWTPWYKRLWNWLKEKFR